jgi:hypothetical protein
MKNKILPIVFALATLLAANNASAYYSPSTGRWLSRDPMGEQGFETLRVSSTVPKVGQIASTASLPLGRVFMRDMVRRNELNEYVIVKNNLESKIDFLGTYSYSWTPTPCQGNGVIAGFIQVGLGGGTLPPTGHPFVDDGTHGLGSTKPNCPPLTPSSDGGIFEDSPGVALGGGLIPIGTHGMNGLQFEVCHVCLIPCCGSYHTTRGNNPFTGYKIVHIGPCMTYTITEGDGNLDLASPGVGTSSDSPSSTFSQTVNGAYPNILSGGCISCKNPN